MTTTKLASWGGANKSKVRLFKKHDIVKFIKKEGKKCDRPEDWQPHMLSFPGPKAVLERLLVNQDVLPADNITAIQTYEKLSAIHDGKTFLNSLINTRKRYLSGMRIWPYNFHRFSQKYKLNGCDYPSNSKQAKWGKPPYKGFMDKVVKSPVERFSIIDLDLCGVFSQKNADSVENLFKHRVVEPSGVLFLTHQKGRDVRDGTLFNILHGYLQQCRFINFDTIPHINEEGYETYVARYILIPLYYMCKAFEYGYTLKMERLIEYRDFGADAGNAVNMLQYFFRWKDTDYAATPDTNMRRWLENVINEDYDYLNWVD